MLRIFFDDTLSSSSNQSYFYISVPSRFGKTVNLDMIHTFAAINLDETGKPKLPKDTVVYELFQGLKIGKYSDVVDNHLGRYPILHLDFFGIAGSNTTIEQLTLDLNAVLWYELDQFPELKNLTEFPNYYNISRDDIEFMRTLSKKNLTINQITDALANLSRILYLYFNHTQVIVLIDDYDLTAQDSLTLHQMYTVPIYEYLNKMLANAFVKSKMYIRNVLMCGITTLTFSIDEMFKAANPTKYTEIKAHYQPYLSSQNYISIYNTLCISEYFKNRGNDPAKPDLFQRYWADSEEPGRITNFLLSAEYRAKLIQLIVKNTFVAKFAKSFAPDALEEFVKLREREYRGIELRHVKMFYKYTFEIGYLTHTKVNGTFYAVPNYDAKMAIENDLQLYHDMNPKNCSNCNCQVKCSTFTL
ncbi:hypothetical protein U1Q18_048960 [Sarracenia purpurea var. burkii]